ncbi:hypothetical protein FKW31_03790 [Acetobacter sp. DmW_136]|uniref:hypothetical protein n=1 Tax=Acetobacter sp. DmW_136 TaxID=2591091 RepID=UPI00123B4CE1|nr:hypothetical protein [Acetobacter sp. DmW_136]KAA8387770.1 hypothetical protein FKW31_03790 [Acetobacter sp. DmW_136]
MARARMAETIREQINLATRNVLASQSLHDLVARECRDLRDAQISSGAASTVFSTFVDGRRNDAEEHVRLDNGIVSYVFSYLAQGVAFALAECQKRSPVHTGAFRKGWAVCVNGKWWTRPAAAIQPGSIVEIVNTMPYARKIDTGGQITSVPPGIVEAVRQATRRQFPMLTIARKFINLTGGQDARGGPLPYVLKAQGIESGLTWSKSDGFERLRKPRRSNRKDRAAGQVMTYPALVLTESENG